jgi:hypothetical protein
MDKVEKIGSEIKNLSEAELIAFRQWFHEYDAQLWDNQITNDVAGGKLDSLAERALKDLKTGRCREI